jgi:2-polyprenyl-3-methyl-5-hydroxy-6-metoxy-1,4-benzoquinol methylase
VAKLATITVAERLFRILPPGTHDPELFITPSELRAALEAEGFEVGPFVGLGPTGLDRRGDFTFGRVPSTAILYMGDALKPA